MYHVGLFPIEYPAILVKKIVEYCISLRLKLVQNATATVHANGQVQRYNFNILAAIAASIEDEQTRSGLKIKKGFHTTVKKATRFSPCKLFLAYEPRGMYDSYLRIEIDLDVVYTLSDFASFSTKASVNIKKLQVAQKQKYRIRTPDYRIGQLVLVRKDYS